MGGKANPNYLATPGAPQQYHIRTSVWANGISSTYYISDNSFAACDTTTNTPRYSVVYLNLSASSEIYLQDLDTIQSQGFSQVMTSLADDGTLTLSSDTLSVFQPFDYYGEISIATTADEINKFPNQGFPKVTL